MNNQINQELDRRKIQKLIENGTISAEEIESATVVLECECGTEQDVDNSVCSGCGRDLR